MNPHLERAGLLLRQQRFDLAESEAASALADDPDDAVAHAYMALCLVHREQFDPAVESARRAIGLRPDAPLGHYVLAVVWAARSHFDKAEASAREAISLAPHDPDYHAFLGKVLSVQKRWESALESANAALAIDPEHADAVNLRAEAMRRLGRTADAREQLSDALRVNPDNPDTHATLGWTYLQRGDRKKAEEHFREALRLDPESEWARLGVLESLRAGNPLYRPLLQFSMWMEGLGTRAQWGVILGGYVVYQVARGLSHVNAGLRWAMMPLIVAYVLFVAATWVGKPVTNLLLRLHPFGRLALSRDERKASTWIGLFLLAGLASLAGAVASSISGDEDSSAAYTIWAVYFLVMLIPLSSLFRSPRPQPRNILRIYALALGACGLFFAACTTLLPDMTRSGAHPPLPVTLLHLFGSLAGLAFLAGAIAAPWVSNLLFSRTWKR